VDATLGGGGEIFWRPEARGHQGVLAGMGVGIDRSYLAASQALPRRGVLWFPLEPSHVYAME
jgi:hypothetical protein